MRPSIKKEKTFSQSDFDQFAQISGDKNPIHVDPEFSAATGFGRTVAHGLLICTVLRGLCAELMPQAKQVSQKVKFTAPTYADESMVFSIELIENNFNQVLLSLRVTRLNDGIVTCEGETLMQTREGGHADADRR